MAPIASADQGTRRAAGWMLCVLCAMNLLVFMDRSILAAVLVLVRRETPFDDGAAGLLLMIYSASFCLTLPLMGWLGDRLPRTCLLAVGMGLWGSTTLGFGMAQSYEQMLWARGLSGIGEATCAPIAPSLIADCFPRGQRSRALAAFFVAVPVGAALGYGVGGEMAVWLDWRWAFFLTGLLGVTAALLALTAREPVRGGAGEGEPVRERSPPSAWAACAALARNRAFVGATLGMALMIFALVGMSAWAPTFLVQLRKMTIQDADNCLGVLALATGVGGSALGGWLGDRLSQRHRAAPLWLAGWTALAAVPCLAAALLATQPIVLFPLLAVGLTLIFLNIGPLDATILNVTAPPFRGMAFAMNAMVIHLLGEMPPPYLIGMLSDQTGSLFWSMAVTLPVLLLGSLIFCITAHNLPAEQAAAEGRHEFRLAENFPCRRRLVPLPERYNGSRDYFPHPSLLDADFS